MIHHLPNYIALLFALTTLATLWLFIRTVQKSTAESIRKKSTALLCALSVWLAIQAALTFTGIYSADTNAFPPKIMLLGILPMIITIACLFVLPSGRQFIDSLPLKNLTYINIVRIPVEIVLYWLFLHKAIPQLMTFEGRNFDIIAGITAPIAAYVGFTTRPFNRPLLLVWNLLCTGLLINIVVLALLSAPSPIQQLAFDQPNIAILYFPFSWLPTFIVPVVLFGQLASIRQLLNHTKTLAGQTAVN